MSETDSSNGEISFTISEIDSSISEIGSSNGETQSSKSEIHFTVGELRLTQRQFASFPEEHGPAALSLSALEVGNRGLMASFGQNAHQ